MNSHSRQHTPLNEPFMFVSAEETIFNSETLQSSYPRRPSMKRDVSKTLMHTRSYFGKRQKKSHPEPETPIECPYPTIAPRDYIMSPSWSDIDSPHPLLATPLPSPALEDTGHSLEHSQKALQVGELVNKLNFRLKRLFGSRRGSAEDGDVPLASSHQRCSTTSLNLRGPPEGVDLESNPEHLAWDGSCQLPNVSEFFDANGEIGPSNFYHTADWSAFQKSFQTHGSLAAHTRLNNHAVSHGDADLDRFDLCRGYSMQDHEYEAHKRKDSFFGFDFLRSRRSSKADKGKGRMMEEDGAAIAHQEEAAALLPSVKTSVGVTISSFAELGVLPRVSTEMMPPLSPTEPEDVPEAEFSSLKSSTPSWHHDSDSSTPPDAEAEAQISAARQVTLCHVVPAADSAAACTSPASSVSSVHVSAAAPTTSKGNMESMAAPLCTPTTSHSNPVQDTNTTHPDLTTPATPCILPTVASSSLPPSSSPLSPLSSVPKMQTLNLGPPQHTIDTATPRCSTPAGHSKGTSETAHAPSGSSSTNSSVGLKKSLEEKCWWEGAGEGEKEGSDARLVASI